MGTRQYFPYVSCFVGQLRNKEEFYHLFVAFIGLIDESIFINFAEKFKQFVCFFYYNFVLRGCGIQKLKFIIYLVDPHIDLKNYFS